MGKHNKNKAKSYNQNDVRLALSHIKKKKMSVQGASFFFEVPEETLKKLLKVNKLEDEKPKQRPKKKSILTPELEHELVDYAVNMGTKICAAKTKEQQKNLEEDLATKSINLDCFKAPPQVKWLKVFVKRDGDKFPFYMFKVTPSDCTHFISQKNTKAKKTDRSVDGISLRDNFPPNTGCVSPPRESEYILPHDSEEVDHELESRDAEVLESAPRRQKSDRVQIKREVVEPIEEEEFSERYEEVEEEEEPMERRLIENATLVLKEELNIEEWIEFEKTKAKVNNTICDDSESLDKMRRMEDLRRVSAEYIAPEELVLDKDPGDLELHEFIKMDEECTELITRQQLRKKKEKYPCMRKKKKRKRVNAKPEHPETLTEVVAKLQNVGKIKVES
ncbi:stress response protein NST1-like [Belonocnema kinseyi]|uniref:stress response protein NST1-like n=1 Tax=Belonocnema kinseyi TaxID=2817044 RepID=UPI00143DDEF2|nr:stress response protein NST1-like [Belonocnema kinseyi]